MKNKIEKLFSFLHVEKKIEKDNNKKYKKKLLNKNIYFLKQLMHKISICLPY
jgi:hypothetical protein